MSPSLYTANALMGQPKKLSKGKEPVRSLVPSGDETDTKPKRTLTDEQKQKMKEARERKKQERLVSEEAEKAAQEVLKQQEEQATAAARAKKEAANAKRREVRLKRKADPSSTDKAYGSSSSSLDGTSESAPSNDGDANNATESQPSKPPKKQKRLTAAAAPSDNKENAPPTANLPPQWFSHFVAGILKEKNEQTGVKTTKKELVEKANHQAAEKWKDGYTRERVRGAVDNHVSQMYSMIFR